MPIQRLRPRRLRLEIHQETPSQASPRLPSRPSLVLLGSEPGTSTEEFPLTEAAPAWQMGEGGLGFLLIANATFVRIGGVTQLSAGLATSRLSPDRIGLTVTVPARSSTLLAEIAPEQCVPHEADHRRHPAFKA